MINKILSVIIEVKGGSYHGSPLFFDKHNFIAK